ncbi:hypothetical protein BCY91_11015 [Pelobium manganitolerans]|uniref:Uncharacterized protein n=1 Tax=Pelobium manganitolerans TaxID=1842495 RepID=A0A419S218_9SPHI|nr:GDSL-type esterase/lipase family protein [Pelobium manganitolerans]RKD12775.1 hypothetical protein BCY91_11015 [Pelobium manganitolerans]
MLCQKKVWVTCCLLITFFVAQAQRVVVNKGIGGNNSADLLKRIDKDVIAQSSDMVILMVGTNDMVNSKKFISYEVYRKNYDTLVSKMRSCGIIPILLSSPPIDTGYLFQRHVRTLFTENPNHKILKINAFQKNYADSLGLHFIDIYQAFTNVGSPNGSCKSLIINECNKGIADGIHPTEKGYKFIADKIYRYLKHNKLLKPDMEIICFGDSITYGAYMNGEGTATGDTYPAALHRKLN